MDRTGGFFKGPDVEEVSAVAPKAAMCPKCGMVFETEEELQQHLREQHPEVTSAPDS